MMSARCRRPRIIGGGLSKISSPMTARSSLRISAISPRSLSSARHTGPSTKSAKRRRFLDDTDTALSGIRELRKCTEKYLEDVQNTMARLDDMRRYVVREDERKRGREASLLV